jgi:hypothetical protein
MLDKLSQRGVGLDPALLRAGLRRLEFDPPSLNPSSMRMRGSGFRIPWATNISSQVRSNTGLQTTRQS